jgi:hypothetical protein
MDKFKYMLEKRDYNGMINYCEGILKDLCSNIENNDYPAITTLLKQATNICDSILEMAVAIDIDDEKSKLFAEYLRNDLQSQDETKGKIFAVGDVNEIQSMIAEYWIHSSIYSFMYAIYNIGEYLQRSIVYDSNLINKIQQREAQYLRAIYLNGYVTKDEIAEDTLNLFANDKNKKSKLCSIDENDHVFLTNMGVTFVRNNEDRIMKIPIDVTPSVELPLTLAHRKHIETAVPTPNVIVIPSPVLPYNEAGSPESDFHLIRQAF